jgi:hypothetical protein
MNWLLLLGIVVLNMIFFYSLILYTKKEVNPIILIPTLSLGIIYVMFPPNITLNILTLIVTSGIAVFSTNVLGKEYIRYKKELKISGKKSRIIYNFFDLSKTIALCFLILGLIFIMPLTIGFLMLGISLNLPFS